MNPSLIEIIKNNMKQYKTKPFKEIVSISYRKRNKQIYTQKKIKLNRKYTKKRNILK